MGVREGRCWNEERWTRHQEDANRRTPASLLLELQSQNVCVASLGLVLVVEAQTT